MYGSKGDITKWIGSSTDIDDRKRFEEAQLRSQKLESLGTLAGGIAHDFNNMLLVIQGNAQLAQEMIEKENGGPGAPRRDLARQRARERSRAPDPVVQPAAEGSGTR